MIMLEIVLLALFLILLTLIVVRMEKRRERELDRQDSVRRDTDETRRDNSPKATKKASK